MYSVSIDHGGFMININNIGQNNNFLNYNYSNILTSQSSNSIFENYSNNFQNKSQNNVDFSQLIYMLIALIGLNSKKNETIEDSISETVKSSTKNTFDVSDSSENTETSKDDINTANTAATTSKEPTIITVVVNGLTGEGVDLFGEAASVIYNKKEYIDYHDGRTETRFYLDNILKAVKTEEKDMNKGGIRKSDSSTVFKDDGSTASIRNEYGMTLNDHKIYSGNTLVHANGGSV